MASDRTMRSLAVRAARHTLSCQVGHMHARRACRTTFGAATAGAFLFVLRNAVGTPNVPNFACRAKTLWSCTRSVTRAYRVVLYI